MAHIHNYRECPRLRTPGWYGSCWCGRSKAMVRKQFIQLVWAQDDGWVTKLRILHSLFPDDENWRKS